MNVLQGVPYNDFLNLVVLDNRPWPELWFLKKTKMKKAIIGFIVFLLFHTGYAQSNIFSDIEVAKEYALHEEVPILIVFAGSDWCKPCIQFKKSILQSEAFMLFAEDSLAILYLDFPLKKANKLSPEQTSHNEKLAEQYNRSGAFPAILMINAEEKILGHLAFSNQSPIEFINSCKALSD